MWSHRDPSIRKNTQSNVFVKNLAPNIDSKQLYDTFSKFGNILSCKVATDPMTGQSRGFGYVHFETEESATKAIGDVNGHLINGKPVYVGKFERRTERTTGASKFTNVYVKNVPGDYDESKFKTLFEKFGNVTSVAIRPGGDKHTGLSYGFVNFENHEEAVRAVDGAGEIELGGHRLFCDRFQKRNERMSLLGKLYEDRRREKLEKFKNLNLYVKNLDEDMDETKVRELFTPFGEISSLVVMKDDKGVSRGFGFVCFSNSDDATKALTELNGKVVGTKPLYVNRAQRKEERRVQLEHAFMAGQRMQPVAMFFPPNMPMQPQYMMPPQFRRQVPPTVPMRGGYPQNAGPFFPQQQAGGARPRGRGGMPGSRGGPYPPSRGGGRGQFRGGAGGVPQNRYPREHQPVMQPPMMMPPHQELSASMLASATPEMQKQILGERLYPLVSKENEKHAAKITGMFLEMEISEILTLLEMPAELSNKVREAMAVLEQTGQAQ
jgi:polyadenylate-binding protein